MHVQRKTSEPDGKIDRVDVIRSNLISWGRSNYDDFPWRSSRNHFHALIAEVMLQRTKAEQVVPIYNSFVIRYQTPCDAAIEGPSKILAMLRPLGLNWRIRKIVELILELNRRGGMVPDKFDSLVELPGVGPYAASAYLSLHLGVRAAIVDSNAVRLWSRVFGLEKNGEMRRKKELLVLADRMTPRQGFRDFNYAVLDHTRKICKAKPLCNVCLLNCYCQYYKHQTAR